MTSLFTGLGSGLGWTPALSVTLCTAEAVYAACVLCKCWMLTFSVYVLTRKHSGLELNLAPVDCKPSTLTTIPLSLLLPKLKTNTKWVVNHVVWWLLVVPGIGVIYRGHFASLLRVVRGDQGWLMFIVFRFIELYWVSHIFLCCLALFVSTLAEWLAGKTYSCDIFRIEAFALQKPAWGVVHCSGLILHISNTVTSIFFNCNVLFERHDMAYLCWKCCFTPRQVFK